ncbi:uncharacterized protein LOC111802263 [Cucurbita pepo subsp. pepo]|uniref:Uncharacterized protein LOC111490451 n=1 Tax=Cucurbita maxima TaxID=3661 RepID=A0A6J1K406_CUCMA|nr:uncharacterized protein LOC111490451 [Cucurbita maxima]XP_023542331.1 uncharacterized protein LOC111802263 [Cucurbita pepo subsp. pepo]
MPFSRSMRSHSLTNPPPLAERITEEPITNKTAQSTVTCFYQANISGFWRNVTVLWCKNLMNHTLTITISTLEGDFHCNYKIDIKPWQFWSKKGFKSLELDGNQIDIYWDVRSAKFSTGPEPCSDFYVALVADEEVVLLLGDYKKKAYKRTKSRPALVEALLIYKKENVFAKKCFATRARFDERRKECDIVVEISASGAKDPEMWISIDGVVMVQVKNLQWKFRGNQTVVVNKQSVQVLWDVHDWLFSTPGTGHGLFIFKPGPPECESDKEGSGRGVGVGGGPEGSEDGSVYYSTRSMNSSHLADFCLFLYAWKLE